tara:strand:+ start:1000 stop:1227 length:228 start_codon:yes stop_codon:yes gene_type:complete
MWKLKIYFKSKNYTHPIKNLTPLLEKYGYIYVEDYINEELEEILNNFNWNSKDIEDYKILNESNESVDELMKTYL